MRPTAAHPRACGEHRSSTSLTVIRVGSSPRLRGTLSDCIHKGVTSRLIPAPAGNTSNGPRANHWPAAHPRACGEHFACFPGPTSAGGSSPRLRGTPGVCSRHICRGRLIPAPAGNTTMGSLMPRPAPAHPRACGEHPLLLGEPALVGGSSPRLRGTQQGDPHKHGCGRLIPAPAGNTL